VPNGWNGAARPKRWPCWQRRGAPSAATVATFGRPEVLRYSSDQKTRWSSALVDQITCIPTKLAPASKWVNTLAGASEGRHARRNRGAGLKD
jgi:hypothetical protein